MSSKSKTDGLGRRVMPAVALIGALLGGCSDIYFDRRETVALGADDHLAANRVAQMVDPWPRSSANRNIAFDGQKMQTAVERYRNNRVIPPVNSTTTSMAQQQAQQSAAAATNAVNSTGAPAAAPVK